MSKSGGGEGFVRDSLDRLAGLAEPPPGGVRSGRGGVAGPRWRTLRLRRGAGRLRDDELLLAVSDGRSVAVRRLRRPDAPRRSAAWGARMELFEAILEEVFRASPPAVAPVAALTEDEERALADAGFEAGPLAAGERAASVLDRTRAEHARLLADSLTVEEAAARLGVNRSRIRQRLGGPRRSLYGVKLGREWRLPRFQFDGERAVTGLDAVLRRLPADLHPVAVWRWLSTPNPDLAADEGGPARLCPLDWLRTGRSPRVVAELAAEL